MNDVLAYKLKKLTNKINEVGVSTKSGAEAIADAIYTIAYKVRKYDSQIKVNQRNLDKLNN